MADLSKNKAMIAGVGQTLCKTIPRSEAKCYRCGAQGCYMCKHKLNGPQDIKDEADKAASMTSNTELVKLRLSAQEMGIKGVTTMSADQIHEAVELIGVKMELDEAGIEYHANTKLKKLKVLLQSSKSEEE